MCNDKKLAAKRVSELSSELFFSVFIKVRSFVEFSTTLALIPLVPQHCDKCKLNCTAEAYDARCIVVLAENFFWKLPLGLTIQCEFQLGLWFLSAILSTWWVKHVSATEVRVLCVSEKPDLTNTYKRYQKVFNILCYNYDVICQYNNNLFIFSNTEHYVYKIAIFICKFPLQ